MAVSIRTKIIISFASIMVLISFLGLLAYYNRNLLVRSMLSLEREMNEMSAIADIQLAIDRVVMPPNDYLITGDIKEKEKFRKLVGEVDRGFKRLEELESEEEHLAFHKGAVKRLAVLKRRSEEIFAIPNPIGDKNGARLMEEIDDLANDIIVNYIDRYYELEKEEVESEMTFAHRARTRADIVLASGAVSSVIVAVLLVLYLSRSILKPILEFKKGAHLIWSGNLDHRIEIRDGLEINLLADEFNRMAVRLKESYTGLERKVEERTRELNEANMKLKELSITDSLTGLYNRRYFYEKLTEEIGRAARYNRLLSFIMVDIDYFKHYNDTRGHLEGDQVLKMAASCIAGNVRSQDIVARYGGEEFCVILPETGKEQARKVAERIRRRIEEHPFPHKENQPGGNLTVSIGVASFKDDALCPEELIKKADDALYRAKAKKGNIVEVVGY